MDFLPTIRIVTFYAATTMLPAVAIPTDSSVDVSLRPSPTVVSVQQPESLESVINKYGKIVYETPGTKRVYVIGVMHKREGYMSPEHRELVAENDVQVYRIIDALGRERKIQLLLREGANNNQPVISVAPEAVPVLRREYAAFFSRIDESDDYLQKRIMAETTAGDPLYELLGSLRYGVEVKGGEDERLYALNGELIKGKKRMLAWAVAHQRSAALFRNALDQARQGVESGVALVTGGGHVPDIVGYFQTGRIYANMIISNGAIVVPEVNQQLALADEDIGVTIIRTNAEHRAQDMIGAQEAIKQVEEEYEEELNRFREAKQNRVE